MLKHPLSVATVLCSVAAPLSHGFGTPGISAVRSWWATANPSCRRGVLTTKTPPLILGLATEDDEVEESVVAPSSSGGTSTTVKEQGVKAVKSLFQRLDDGGQKLKPMAQTAKDKADTKNRRKSVMYTIKSCFLFSLFIVYRAYRGFFVILPEVFREVSRKLDTAVGNPFDSNDDKDVALKQDVNPKTGKLRVRTRVTVSVLAGLVTVWYVVGGGFRVLKKFFKTVFSTNKVATSFEAAADEIVVNEDKILRLAKPDKGVNDVDVNGEGLTDVAP